MIPPWLAIVGINEDGVLAPEAAGLVAGAALVVGGARHLALAAPLIRSEHQRWCSPIEDTVPAILARRPAPVAVLASGDPLWFGVASMLLRHVPLAETVIVPAPSSFALAASRLGWALQDVTCLSCCGRPVAALIPHLQPGARLLVLSAGPETPAAIAGLLRLRGMGGSVLRVLEALGSTVERCRIGLPDAVPEDVAALNLVAIEVVCPAAAALPLAPGLDDAWFEHDGQITKHDVRAMTLAALAPRQAELLWDIGCGSGAIGIEWMLRHPANRAVGLEPRPDRAARARRNAEALGVPALQVIEARAPDALDALPPPDAIFLGGGAHRAGVIDAAWSALRPGGRLVANGVTLATEAVLIAAQQSLGGTLSRIAIERLDQVGSMAAYRPAMTVTQWRAVR